VLAVLKAAEVPTWEPEEEELSATEVCALPALRALKVSRRGWATFRRSFAAGFFGPLRTYVNDRGEAFLVVRLEDLLPVLHHSGHRVGCQYAIWACEVEVALIAHGYYAPERQHRPLPGEELEAIEVQSYMREIYYHNWGRPWEETWEHPPEEEGTV
jgi:hypothetical protein